MIPTEEQCLSILKREDTPENVVQHCRAVAGFARELADRVGSKLKINKPALVAAALLHDIARARVDGPHHGVVGAQMVRAYGVDEQICRMIERHIGSGLSDEDAAKLGLPAGKIYLPLTIEEKLLCYADKFIFGESGEARASREDVIRTFKEDIGEGPALERLEKLMTEMDSLCS